jgi:hypothetical protein
MKSSINITLPAGPGQQGNTHDHERAASRQARRAMTKDDHVREADYYEKDTDASVTTSHYLILPVG